MLNSEKMVASIGNQDLDHADKPKIINESSDN